MSKRIFDIIPPEEIGIAQNEVEGGFDLNKSSVSTVSVCVKRPAKKSFGTIKWLALVFVIAIIGVAVWVPAKAEIKIYPKSEEIKVSGTIFVDANNQEVNLETKTIPGKVFTSVQSYSQKYQATGNDSTSKKATGTIRVYNKFSPAEVLTLKSGTHFLSTPKGLSYHSVSVINIPAAKVSGNSIEPGYVDIQIEADESGEEYNLSSATFSVPKLNGTVYYSTTWATTQTAISGGSSSSVKIAIKKDIDTAKEAFKIQSFTNALIALKNTITSDFMVYDDMVTQDLGKLVVGAKENDPVISFDVSGVVSSSVISFKKVDLENLGQQMVLASEEGAIKQIVPSSIVCAAQSYKKDTQNNKLELNVECAARTYWLPDRDFLFKTLAGKSKDYSASILKNLSDVNKAEVNIWPFWKANIPTNNQNIDIKVDFQ